MRLFLLSIALMGVFNLTGQTAKDTIKINLMFGSDTLSGATLTVKDSNPLIGTTTDYAGNAVLLIPTDKDWVDINLPVSYIPLQIIRPVDSIYFNMKSKYATYYYKGKKMKKKKYHIQY